MPRSLRVQKDHINKVKLALRRNGFARQKDLAEELGLSLTTVSNFLNGRPVDYVNFTEICRRLALDWEAIANLEEDSDEQDSRDEQEVPNSEFYVERVPYQSQCYEAILKPGALVRMKAPQQMGKTSLLERVLHQAREQGYQTLTLSFALADSTVFTDLRQFSRWFCASVGQNLGLPNRLADYWDDIFGCNSNTTAYFQNYLLPTINSPLVLALDEVDLVFEHPQIADDFCRLLRGWYDIAKRGDRSSALWKQLRLVVVHSTEVYTSLDINHSPLGGVGLVIELPELTRDEVQDLARRHGLNWSVTQVEQLMAMVGGHPYLVQLTLDRIRSQGITLEHLLQTAPTEAGIYSDYLRRHLRNLQQHPELMAAFREVVEAGSWVKIESDRVFKLHSMGLVKLFGNEVMPRCDLYRQYFRDRVAAI
jgi:transcriptional regulator with XRE-family HTH domain